MVNRTTSSLPPTTRVFISLFAPIIGAILFSWLITVISGESFMLNARESRQTALLFAGIGLVSWFLGWRWYGLPGIGLRFGRPFFASTGFAFLGWTLFLIVRLVVLEPGATASEQPTVPFLFLLIFEAFSTQVWTYGLFFRSVADWRGPLAAAVSSGVIFGGAAYLLFQESFTASPGSALFFIIWGVFYGFIRLRTGSILGTILIQAMQSWSSWQLFKVGVPDASQLRTLYLIMSGIFLIIIWRLWPKKESDYRI